MANLAAVIRAHGGDPAELARHLPEELRLDTKGMEEAQAAIAAAPNPDQIMAALGSVYGAHQAETITTGRVPEPTGGGTFTYVAQAKRPDSAWSRAKRRLGLY
jgi:hypothetical protein